MYIYTYIYDKEVVLKEPYTELMTVVASFTKQQLPMGICITPSLMAQNEGAH